MVCSPAQSTTKPTKRKKKSTDSNLDSNVKSPTKRGKRGAKKGNNTAITSAKASKAEVRDGTQTTQDHVKALTTAAAAVLGLSNSKEDGKPERRLSFTFTAAGGVAGETSTAKPKPLTLAALGAQSVPNL